MHCTQHAAPRPPAPPAARSLGYMPIMVRSQRCWLHGLSRQELVAAREEANEMGGYFVCNGIERIIR